MSFRNTILVVGPPRSGTSAVCHVLNECGIDFGDPAKFVDPAVNAHNPLFFELVELNELNERMIARMGWSYNDFNATPLQDDFTSALADEFDEDVTQFVAQFADAPLFGLKDPRFCFTLPLWQRLLSRHGIRSRILRTRRNLESVASSNFRLSPERGIEYGRRVALLSDSAAAYFLRNVEHEIVRFEDMRDCLPKALQALASTASVDPAEVRGACSRVFRDELVHWRSSGTTVVSDADASAEDYESLGLTMRKFGLRPCADEEKSWEIGKASLNQRELTLGDQPPFIQGAVQVYYRRELEVFSEERSVTVPWPSGNWEETVAVELPNAGGEYVRIDVNSAPGAYVIRELSIDGFTVVPLLAFVGANGAAYELPDGAIGLVANHGDPWVYFRSPHGPVSALTVRIQRMTPEEAGRRLFEDSRIERAIEGLQQKMSQFNDRTLDHVARLHQTIAEESGHLATRAAEIEARLSRGLVEEVGALGEKQAALIEGQSQNEDRLRQLARQFEDVGSAQAKSMQDQARDGDRLRALAEQLEGIRSTQVQSVIDRAQGAVHIQEVLGSLEEMRRISLMGWWEKRQFQKGKR